MSPAFDSGPIMRSNFHRKHGRLVQGFQGFAPGVRQVQRMAPAVVRHATANDEAASLEAVETEVKEDSSRPFSCPRAGGANAGYVVWRRECRVL